uniref:Major allergen Pru ar 1 n=1 Tax=Anthurium amnicola TaxID=1678845 RepID=A0A1D1YFB3_9ARAE
MVAGSFTEEYESPIPVLKAWKAGVLDAHIMIPKLLPDIISSVDVLEGNGGVGTVKQFNFTEAVKEHKFIKDRVDVLDDHNYVFKYTVIEGGLLGTRFKSYSYELKLEAAGGGGSKGKLTVHYDTIDDTPLTEEEVGKLMIGVVGMMKALEVYFQANPNLYA